VEAKKPEYHALAQVEHTVDVDRDERVVLRRHATTASAPLLLQLRAAQHPGLILFSSGSSGSSKAVVHDSTCLLERYEHRGRGLRTIASLRFDHIGGFNTLFYTLANGGCLVTPSDRSPDAVCGAIQAHRAQLLPTSPTFLNLLLLSEAYGRFDLSSLELITYGTEVMPESTLRRLRALLPRVRLRQTYGLSEVGILRSQSASSESLWVKVGGEGFETRVVDGLLEIRARSAMLGYLNAPSPFTADGWLRTGDAVEVDGPFVRILGRHEELINVGGEKVYPAEVESALRMMDGVQDVTVRGAANAITGQMVTADVQLGSGETLTQFRTRMHRFCRDKLPAYKIPQKVVLVTEATPPEHFKKMRRVTNAARAPLPRKGPPP
jgi:acyl-coenzyme A synthetase/AMP-(fatty) acid ligase